jgi:uroporphyrinogen-III synthase
MTNLPRICSFESRRADEMARLIKKMGGRPTLVPSMEEIPIENNPDVFQFADKLFSGSIDIVVFLTGVGAQALLEVVKTRFDRDQFLDALRTTTIVIRGPKPAAVLKQWNVPWHLRAPEPNTWRETLKTIDDNLNPKGRTVAVQEYGVANEQFYSELRQRGARVIPVSVYRWSLPDNTAPLESAINATIAGDFDALMFTSAQQVRNVLEIAGHIERADEWRAAAARCVIASIGPTCSAAIQATGLTIDYEASPPKMGPLVRGTIENLRSEST